MKKYFKVLFLFLALVSLTGCKKNIVTKCTNTVTQEVSNYTETKEYTVYAKGDTVKKIVFKDTIDTKNNTIRLYFENLNKQKYEDLNKNYGGVKYDVSVKGKLLTTNVTINYKKFDMKKYVKDDNNMKYYVDKNNKLTYKGAIDMLKLDGLKCDK